MPELHDQDAAYPDDENDRKANESTNCDATQGALADHSLAFMPTRA